MNRDRQLSSRERISRLLRFGIVGAVGTLIYYSLALTCVWAGLAVESAHIVAFLVSIIASYFGQKILTFRVRGAHKRNLTRFAIATGLIAALQLAIVSGLKMMALDVTVIFAISSVYYPVASFLTHWLWTFRPRQAGKAQEKNAAYPPR